MRRLNEEQLQQFATAFLTQARAISPDWSNFNESDPGVTLLELFTFLTENLLYRQNQIPERGIPLAQRLAYAALALARASKPDDVCLLARVNSFEGQLLSAEDFRQEQNYFRARLRRRSRFLHGAGVVSGLQVSLGKNNQGPHVTVQPGFALDRHGEELELCTPRVVPLPLSGKSLLVQLLFVENPTSPVPVATSGDASTEEQFSRIEETVAIVLVPELKTDAVSIARLLFTRGHWRVDRSSKPPRVA